MLVRHAIACLTTMLAITAATAARPVPPGTRMMVRAGDGAATVAAYVEKGRVRRLYGAAMARGVTPAASAERLLVENAALLGVDRADLRPVELVPGAGPVHGLMHDAATGSYRFSVLHFEQMRDEVPVFGARLTVLVRNEPTHPVVLVNPDVRDLGALRVAPVQRAAGPNPAGTAAALERVRLLSELDGDPVLASARRVIWAGLDDAPRPARLADEVVVDLDADTWRVVTDAETGAVLYQERVVCFVNLAGSTSGLATEGLGGQQCAEEVPGVLPYARIETFPSQVFTSASGNFAISGLTGSTVTVTASLLGRWFEVFNFAGTGVTETMVVTPPASADFVFNSANDNELVRAQVNAYVESNRVRTFVLDVNPDYPTLDSGAFPVTVNRGDGFCPGNAWYNPSGGGNMNFCRAGGEFSNTAFSSVVYHEYGHHLVHAGGSGQGAYGEGMADAIAVLMQDQPELGIGFREESCDSGLRSADNDLRYPCWGEIHYCGQLLSGCVWSIRNELVSTNPGDYPEILGGLVVNSILLHSGTSIAPGISIDFLTLDDDNETIFDGTPHFDQLTAGFAAHGMVAPELALLAATFPDGLPEYVSPAGGTVRVEITGVTAEPQPGSGVLHYDDGTGLQAIPMQEVAPNVYDAFFPPAPCRARLSYYVTVETTGGDTATWPDGAPAERFAAMSAAGEIPILTDDFETDAGWAVEDENLEDGSWERGVPSGSTTRGAPPTDEDGSGQCWLTDNGNGSTDVDGGPTRLISPPFDLSGADDPEIGYARWFTNNDDDIDRLDVHLSDDDGETWTLLESVPNEPSGWMRRSFRVRDFIDLTPEVRVRYSCADDPDDSVTEAAIDALKIFEIACDVTPCPADLDEIGGVGFNDLAILLGNWGDCQGQPVGCAADLDADGIVGFNDLVLLLGGWGPCE